MVLKLRLNNTIILLGVILILAFALQLYHLSSFEFKNDQLQAIILGNDARRASFMITHGTGSGAGINNPPLFIWIMAVITFFTNNPLYITTLFMFLNILALVIALIYFYKTLPKLYTVFASVFLAFSPAFSIYSNIIWAQCLLPPLMIMLHYNFYKFIKEDSNNKYFIMLGIIAAFASQLHLSGFFLFPTLVILATFYRHRISLKTVIVTTLFIFIVFLPYMYHLFYEKELDKFISYGNFMHGSIYWKVFREHLRMASFDFFRYYFRYDFPAVLEKSMGFLRFIFYPLSCIWLILFAIGILSYVMYLIKGHRFFDLSEEESSRYPLPFQIAGFLILLVTLGYLIFKIHTPPHYLILLFPSYAILTAYPAYKVWKFLWAKVIVLASMLATFCLLAAVLVFVRKAGGHPHEYGPNYGTLLECKDLVWSKVPLEFCPDLSLAAIVKKGADKFDRDTVYSVIMANRACGEGIRKIPLMLTIAWNERSMRYDYKVDILKKGD